MAEPPVNDPQPLSDPVYEPPAPVAPAPQKGRWSGFSTLVLVLFRLLVLGGGIGLGWLLGAVAARFFPAPAANPPLQEVVQRRTHRVFQKVQDLPQWWQDDLTVQPTAADLETVVPSPTAAPAPPPVPTLSETEQIQINEELAALGTDLTAIDNRLSDLEQQLAQPSSEAPLEYRLERLSQVYTQSVAGEENASSAPAAPTAAAPMTPATPRNPVATRPLFQQARDRVTLPTGLLFEPNQAVLSPNGERLLDTIAPDLARYPNASILIGSHSDGTEAAEVYRDLTFRQALAIQQYLQLRLGEGYHWVTIGYGQSRPLVEGTDAAAQARNQRVEIAIVPPS